MYSDDKRFPSRTQPGVPFGDPGVPPGVGALSEMDKCFPYSILTKKHPLGGGSAGGTGGSPGKPSAPPTVPSYLGLQRERSGTNATKPEAAFDHSGTPDVNNFYGSAMVTDVGICFSMSNVNLNGHPPTIPLATGALVPPAAVAAQPRPSALAAPDARRKSYEDPGPETALLNARRRAAAFLPVTANGGRLAGPMAGSGAAALASMHHHHQQRRPQAFPFPAATVYPLAHHPPGTVAAPFPQPLANVHPPVHQPLPRQRSVGPVGKGAYGSVRSTSSDRGRGGGSGGSPSMIPAIGTLGGIGTLRSSPPYPKQPPGAATKPSAVSYYQPLPATGGPGTVQVQPSYAHPLAGAPTSQSTPTAPPPPAPPVGYHHQRGNVLQYHHLPLANGVPLAGPAAASPATAAAAAAAVAAAAASYEYYRYAIEAAESVGKLPPSGSAQSVLLPTGTMAATPARTAGEDGSKGASGTASGPVVDYNGLRQLFLKCCYNEMKLLPASGGPAHPAAPVLSSPTVGCVSAPTSTATSLSADSPVHSYDFEPQDPRAAGREAPAVYPSGQQQQQHHHHHYHQPLTSRSCPSSPNGPHCHTSPALPTLAPSACSTPIGSRRLSAQQQHQQHDRYEASEDEVRPMEVCSEDGQEEPIEPEECCSYEPKDFSMKSKALSVGQGGVWPAAAQRDGCAIGQQRIEDRSRKEIKAAPKKKWIHRHYMKGSTNT
uniref:Uncharacterized protein n=1 Tax=Anopheles merus TaxID=30066 RepID=A0A182VFG2_ANOME